MKIKNLESLRYYTFAINFFFTFINEEFFNSSYYSYKSYHPSLCKLPPSLILDSFHENLVTLSNSCKNNAN